MMFKFYNTDGKFICEVIIENLEQIEHISIIYNKRPMEVDFKNRTLKLIDR